MIPFNAIINWLVCATTGLPSIVNGNTVLSPSNKLAILSNFCEIEVKISSEEVNLLFLNRTWVLSNSL
jgi:hypothetical protein